ncbi:MAG: hypothetical protein M1829_005524 [Trizodia sp. TS-e1964]|nr:MAG: hypothetical protein M1829_005524 [Trizodia sp. TS-e1964]
MPSSSPQQSQTPLPDASARRVVSTPKAEELPPRVGPLQTPGGPRSYQNRRIVPKSPHALRAHQHRVANTPGRARRRSARHIRDTPRDGLRDLSRLLAKSSKPILPSPDPFQGKSAKPLAQDEYSDDDLEIPQTRFSLPRDADDDSLGEDDSFQVPPRLSLPLDDEDNLTVQSIEAPRRAASERPSRLSRGSFGSLRMSDRFADLNELGFDAFSQILEDEGISFPDYDDYNEELADRADAELPPLDLGEDTLESQRGYHQSASAARQRDIVGAPFPLEVASIFNARRASISSAAESEVARSPEGGIHAEGDEVATPELTASLANSPSRQVKPRRRANVKKAMKTSRHGIPYPSLPMGVVKRLSSKFSSSGGKSKLGKDAMDMIMKASDWFFEQMSDDLGTYAKHAGRKTIDESDVITLMKRQRLINASTTPFSLAQKYLPREMLKDVRMAPPARQRGRKGQRARMENVEEEGEEEGG